MHCALGWEVTRAGIPQLLLVGLHCGFIIVVVGAPGGQNGAGANTVGWATTKTLILLQAPGGSNLSFGALRRGLHTLSIQERRLKEDHRTPRKIGQNPPAVHHLTMRKPVLEGTLISQQASEPLNKSPLP